MCEAKRYKKIPNTRIDECLRGAISTLNAHGFKTVASCCGHKKYPLTIIYPGKSGGFFDLFSGIKIPRKRNFYKRDKQGYYYIQEVK